MATITTAPENIKVGDIVEIDVGYSMTLPHFYKVLGFTPSGKSARVVELKSQVISHDGYGQAGYKIPTDTEVGKIKTCRIKNSSYSGAYISIDKHWSRKWNGTPSWYDTYD